MIPAASLLITSFFFFLELIFFIACSLRDLQNFFITIFSSVYVMLIYYASKWWYCRHWKTWWNMLAYFCCRWIFRIIFTSFNLFYYTLKICIYRINGDILDFWYWLNSNILVSFEGITTLQKSYYILFMRFKILSVAKERRQFRQ